jgi:hypothetical protein
MKIVVGVNTLTSVDQAVYSNHCQMWFRFGRKFPDATFILNHPKRMNIDNMRNLTAKVALDQDADYILFIDDDVIVPPMDVLESLLSCNADVAAGWTIIRGYPFKNMFFEWTDETKVNLKNCEEPFIYDSDGNIPCAAVGFSCALIKVESLKLTQPPYFVTGPYNTEDIYYCMKLLNAKPDAKIVVNPLVKTSHGLGIEYIDPLNKEFYKNYVETLDPNLLVPPAVPEQQMKMHDEPVEGVPTYDEVLKEAIFGK